MAIAEEMTDKAGEKEETTDKAGESSTLDLLEENLAEQQLKTDKSTLEYEVCEGRNETSPALNKRK